LHYPKKGGLRPQHILDRLDKLGGRDSIVVTDVGQHQMWAAQFLRTTRNRHWLSSGGAGTMGFGFPGGHRRQAGLARPVRCGPSWATAGFR